MSTSSYTSSTSRVTAPSGNPSSRPHPWRNLVRNSDYPSPAPETLLPETLTPPGIPPDDMPAVISPRAGTLGYFLLERNLAAAMNTPLESNLIERESGGAHLYAENKNDTGLKGMDCDPVEETPERSCTENKLIFHPSQTGGAVAHGLDSSRSRGSQEGPWVPAGEGNETSEGELARVLKCLHDGRVKLEAAGKSVWGYLGYGGSGEREANVN
ncbi:hypothetical protein HOY82DRAFT_600324 [Tuber indicum]|nr:hypothetical protein HOY82DRAFT_600324 [Tuber indicum]